MKHLRPALLSLSLFSVFSAQAVLLDHVAAVVGDEPILRSEVLGLKKEIAKTPALASAYRLQPGQFNDQQLLERMIEDRIVRQSVKDLEISVTDAEVEAQIASIAKQNGINRNQLEESLKREKISLEDYKRNIKSQLERRNLFDRELRKGGGITETELRELYAKNSEPEVKLSVLSLPRTEANRKKLVALAKAVHDGETPLKEAIESSGAESLDWLQPSTLDPKFKNALAKAAPGEAIGPLEVDKKTWKLLLFEGQRKGSDEAFEAHKNELMAQAQAQDFDRRFGFWLERKRQEMHIVENKP